MFRTVLVANRGEIAVRVLRTLREMGIRGVAVWSDADRGAPHVAAADEAIPLGDPTPAASYLDGAKIIDAARRTGAEAIHPGYGFLSESPAFARAVRDAGLVFVGPTPEAMERVGNKVAARRLLRESAVPVVPGMTDPEADPERLAAAAAARGYPVILKAAAGGGGKGMRIVRGPAELAEAARRGASEALAAFGDGAVYLEKLLSRPRHVEIQVLADGHGRAVHLGERECSIQRRHQKLLEESPSPALDADLRRRMGEAALEVARRAGYVNAGTVEFLLEEDGRFHFLEVNARLQVEHPVTEMRTGLDLVRCQLEIAAGMPLGLLQEDVAPRGHAIECRVYAEDPAAGFLPSPGRILLAREPRGPGIRCDSGIATGSEVPVHYDPILAKVVAHAATRDAAIARTIRALEECVVLGVATPIELLLDVLGSEPFRAGRTHTAFLEEHFAGWAPRNGEDLERLAAVGKALESRASRRGARLATPWERLGAWDVAGSGEARVVASSPGEHAVEIGGRIEALFTAEAGAGTWVWHRGRARLAGAAPAARTPAAAPSVLPALVEGRTGGRGSTGSSRPEASGGASRPPGAVTPPMPSVVVAVLVEVGRKVARGAPLVVVSAMKMESQLAAPIAGRVKAVHAAVGAKVRPGDVLVEVEPEAGE
ncbi:MAG TPA: biotin carboxylase N-terminal domain-containing protein [Anaeromyxobacter sp.]|nr:biotin carboxylase N-terminal domain-containing protein [Anaeromyxobacter sp.]